MPGINQASSSSTTRSTSAVGAFAQPLPPPGIDSISMMAALMVPNGTSSPRNEIPLNIVSGTNCTASKEDNGTATLASCALIVGDFKLVTGSQDMLGYWTGPQHPNGSYYDVTNQGCPTGCLFNIKVDPTEHVDLSNASSFYRSIFSHMMARLGELATDVFDPTAYVGNYTRCLDASEYADRYNGFHGPACFKGSANRREM